MTGVKHRMMRPLSVQIIEMSKRVLYQKTDGNLTGKH